MPVKGQDSTLSLRALSELLVLSVDPAYISPVQSSIRIVYSFVIV